MGCCLSTSSRSTDDAGSSSCLEIGLCGQKKGRRTFSDHVVSLQKLTSLPNRIFSNGKSRSSCIFTQQGRKGVNQDAMIVWEDFVAEDAIFCGVFDGHGPYGHLVARKVRDALPIKLLSFLDSSESRRSKASFKKEIKPESGEAENDFSAEEEMSTMWREAFMKAYKAMDKELKSHANLDCFCSGSTSVTIVKQGSNLFMGNIGDSRAIMGSKDSNDSMVAIQLTVDLKPDLPREAERIKKCKGRVFALEDEPEVPRVWLPYDDAPGLAMARAFGDFCLKEYGVISIPEFTHRLLTDKDQFIVLASDGIWDVLSNEEVVEIVSSAPNRSSAARVHRAQEMTYAKMTTDLSNELNEVEIRLKQLREMAIKNCRKLSAGEKKSLAADIARLSAENLIRALEIVAETNPNFRHTENEVELDFNAQSDYTLWRLKLFVKRALEDEQKNSGGTFGNQNTDEKRNNSRKRRDFCDDSAKNLSKTRKLSTF